MKTFKMSANSEVKLNVKISTEALVGTNVKLDSKILKKSSTYNFSTNLGNSTDIVNKKLNVVTNCFVTDENIDPILENAVFKITLKDDENEQSYEGKKLKIDDEFFIVFTVVELVKN
ncbi:hypothetical protein ATO12_02265 [Aquimarina atlantica]|uniref:Uncharacterized protein n=1 Tax=Aquimarina atlantica TaxID=1317122 RepID=A0A023C0A9_9FLAO|nr:hypothetical protein [Aquimarina atlantica]EZH75634.1 hypothetical protein ATO12_02265 [Aquimarina atlantica]